MDIYLFCVILGAVGLLAMALTGLGRHGHAAGPSPGGHGHAGHAGGHGTAVAAHGHGHGHSHGAVTNGATWLLMTPRLAFAGLLGFGSAGMLLRSFVGGTLLVLAAIAGAVVFERLLVNPLWKFALRFASNPATTIEAAIQSDAVAVSNFDRNGQGIIAVEVDGHMQQVLATLMPADRAAGATVRAGQHVRIEEVDSERQRCSVTVL